MVVSKAEAKMNAAILSAAEDVMASDEAHEEDVVRAFLVDWHDDLSDEDIDSVIEVLMAEGYFG
jgi:hypothetical protein